ncbi:LytR/AlgR family response regulator transcription factor [Sediminitomix flava]|uniref:LytTR family two component transcriptional regulator n=1 Tax=Sediminitomix flava TaxID=379075 RepID=A0A315ZCH2_SEDFL|nr:response regulator [Sediminitomix flava]PWJ43231.1 LytTR family two component transcriptional regulator [Sediminitomix flava]
MKRILIVEDEILIAEDLKLRLEIRGFEIIGIAINVQHALALLSEFEVDLCLLDINLGEDVDGVQLAAKIKDEYQIPIIFLTSYGDDDTFKYAKRVKPEAYLTKPFNELEVSRAIELALQSEVQDPQHSETGKSIFLNKKGQKVKVGYHEILWAEAQSNYTLISTLNGFFILSVTLREFEERLQSPQLFLRVHRSYLISKAFVETINGNNLKIGKKQIPISRSRKSEIIKHFDFL